MRYVGSKARFRKELLPIILADRDPDQYYVEPFAGGFNLICHVDGPRIGNDIDSDVVACMKAISEGWDPPETLSEQEYSEIRSDPGAYPQHLVGFVSVGCSYSGKKWGGARQGKQNPVSIISSKIRKPDQIIQPWMFGHDASKKTCLWLKNLPLLQPTDVIEKDLYANQTPSGQNKLGPSEDRWKLRSVTYTGIAEAMAEQWGYM